MFSSDYYFYIGNEIETLWNVEKRLGRSVISSERAIDHTNPSDSLPLNEPGDFGTSEEI